LKRFISIVIYLSSFIVLLLGCSEVKQEELQTIHVVTEGDFIYRLVTEESEYKENGPIRLIAELEYVGDKEDVLITHAASPFSFSMVETTRDYEISYPMAEPEIETVIRKGKPLRKEYTGGAGAYGAEDKKNYVTFIQKIMKKEFPNGHYIVNGLASYTVLENEETGQEKDYNLKARVEFKVKSSN